MLCDGRSWRERFYHDIGAAFEGGVSYQQQRNYQQLAEHGEEEARRSSDPAPSVTCSGSSVAALLFSLLAVSSQLTAQTSRPQEL